MIKRERNVLIEASVTAHRERDLEGRLKPPAEWWDLAPEALDELFQRQLVTREIERVMDPQGQTATVKAVLARIERAFQQGGPDVQG
jgi:hypothetical protein